MRRCFNAIVEEIKEYSKSLGFRIDFRDARGIRATPEALSEL